MIDNIVLLITGTLHGRPINELISKCHPLGSFEQMEAIHIASTPAELYNAVLVDTPLGNNYDLVYLCITRLYILSKIQIKTHFSTIFCWLHKWARFGWNECRANKKHTLQGVHWGFLPFLQKAWWEDGRSHVWNFIGSCLKYVTSFNITNGLTWMLYSLRRTDEQL